MAKYYLDTCIWMDYWFNRSDRFRPLGEWAIELINRIVREDDVLVVSDANFTELMKFRNFSREDFLKLVPEDNLMFVLASKTDKINARSLANETGLCYCDALHALLAKKHDAILITRDRHFDVLFPGIIAKKPEELI